MKAQQWQEQQAQIKQSVRVSWKNRHLAADLSEFVWVRSEVECVQSINQYTLDIQRKGHCCIQLRCNATPPAPAVKSITKPSDFGLTMRHCVSRPLTLSINHYSSCLCPFLSASHPSQAGSDHHASVVASSNSLK